MAEQGSDSAKTESSEAELVRQRLDQSTRLARARQAGLHCCRRRIPARNRGRNARRRAVSGARTDGGMTARGACGLRAVTCQPWTGEVRQ